MSGRRKATEGNGESTDADARTPADHQAIATVIGRRDREHDRPNQRLDLYEVDLSCVVWCEEAQLAGANLSGANLERASLVKAQLAGARLGGAHLEGADLSEAQAEGANLAGAHPEGANLAGARKAYRLELLCMLRRAREELGRWSPPGEWEFTGSWHVSRRAYVRHFGTWRRACRMAARLKL